MQPAPFYIRVSDAVLADLQLRLRETHWSSPTLASGWERGTSERYLQELVTYWLGEYDWRAEETSLNRMPQFEVRVADAKLHFVHHRSRRPRPMPLLLLHGWPDSFYRYYKVLPKLVGDGFDVVVPSLPGFAFTGKVPLQPVQPTRQSAELLWRLMTEVLGYRQFGVAGGDGGSVLAQLIAIDHPESVVGIHLTDLGWQAGNVDPAGLSKSEKHYLEAGKKLFMKDGAYAALQSTRPHSLAPALEDSPAGLAAWIVDRFHSWCDCDGNLEHSFTKDELLTNIMIYWVTNTIGSSMDSYRADLASPSLTPRDFVEVPVGLALFPKDGAMPPRSFAERTLNIQRWCPMPHGGHFAALEEPELYARDVASFFRDLRSGRPIHQESYVGRSL